MSLNTGYSWSHKDIKLVGYSIAGVSTSIVFPAADVCFDVAQGLPFQVPVQNILITHGHMDHAGGLPYLLGQKAMRHTPPADVYMPDGLLKPMQEIMRVWSRIEGHSYRYNFHAIRAGQEAPLKAPYYFRPFKTVHRVESQGYTVFQRKKKLKVEFAGLPPQQLGELRRSGTAIEEIIEEPVLSFTGDTQIEFLADEHARRSRVLVMEVTYWDAAKSIANAREWGHIHLDELIPRLDDIRSEKIVLIHSSARYTAKTVAKILDERLPEQHKSRVEIFPRPD